MAESNFWKNWKNVFFLFLLYLPAHFLLLFSKAIMWDGWLWGGLLKQKNYETLYQLLEQARLLHLYAVFRAMDFLGDPVMISDILVFAAWFVAGVCIYLILRDFARIGEKNSFFIAAAFLLSPIFIVRFEAAFITYSFNNMIFFLGAYAFLRAGTAARFFSKITLRVLAAGLFITAFFTASFIVFYGVLILFALFIFLQKKFSTAAEMPKRRIDDIYAFSKKNIFWILLPAIFYLAQQKFIGTPYGVYEGYNSFVFSNQGISFLGRVLILIDRAYQFVVYGFFGPIIFSFSALQRKIFLAVFLFFLACIFFLERKGKILSVRDDNDSNETNVWPKNIFIWGVLLFIFGALAYILVGESPNPYGSGFDMRHGLILPIGSSLIILAFINGLLKNKIRKAAKIIILAVFITYNIYNYYSVDMDWYKQVGIIESIREKQELGQIGEKDIFVFYDKLPMYSWRGRPILAHEYTAYLYEATGNLKLMGSDAGGRLQSILNIKKEKIDFTDKRTLERFKNIIISSDISQEPTVPNWTKIKMADLFYGKDALRSAIKDLIGIKIEISAQTPKEDSWLDKLPKMQ